LTLKEERSSEKPERREKRKKKRRKKKKVNYLSFNFKGGRERITEGFHASLATRKDGSKRGRDQGKTKEWHVRTWGGKFLFIYFRKNTQLEGKSGSTTCDEGGWGGGAVKLREESIPERGF